MWGALRGHNPRFTRQLIVSHYILDFACRAHKVGVELDGGQHGAMMEEDAARTAYLEAKGWTILRFWNTEVMTNLDGVHWSIIEAVARAATHPRPLPFREGS